MIQPGLRIGRYEVGTCLGTGGFGVVYLARDVELGRELALKILRPEYQMQPDVVGRFLKEARAAAKIDHPGIVTVFECGYISGTGTGADGNAYIAMELLRGHSLAQHLERRGRLAVSDTVLIARQIAVALAVAHGAGIVHRDLKPDNVFLLPDPLVRGGYRVKILDFGVAKLAEPKELGVNTHSQIMLGTPKYMSPEQARSAASVDHRTDIYTLGCLLFEMVTGQAPYDGAGAVDLIIQHTTAPVPSAAARVPDLPRGLDALIQQMLAKEPAERPDSMVAIDGALAAIAEASAGPSLDPIASPPMRSAPRPTPPPPILATPGRGLAPVAGRPVRPTPAPPIAGSAPRPFVPPIAGSAPRPFVPPTAGSGPRPFAPPPSFPTIDSVTTELDVNTIARPPVRRRDHRARFAITGLAAAGIVAMLVWLVLRRAPSSATASTRVSPDAALAIGAQVEPAALRGECQRLVDDKRWDELATCSDRLDPVDPELARQLRAKATDEKINEQQLRRLDDELRKGDFEAANTLVKRIPDESVYKAEARRRYDEARRRSEP